MNYVEDAVEAAWVQREAQNAMRHSEVEAWEDEQGRWLVRLARGGDYRHGFLAGFVTCLQALKNATPSQHSPEHSDG